MGTASGIRRLMKRIARAPRWIRPDFVTQCIASCKSSGATPGAISAARGSAIGTSLTALHQSSHVMTRIWKVQNMHSPS